MKWVLVMVFFFSTEDPNDYMRVELHGIENQASCENVSTWYPQGAAARLGKGGKYWCEQEK